jgi:MFS family permease
MAVAACGLVYFTLGQDGQMVVATLPRLGHDLAMAPTTAVWLLLAGSAATGGLMLPAGRWADVTGKRLAFIIGTLGYAGAAGLAAASPSVGWLIAARAAQGAFNALLMVLVITVAVESAGPGGRAAAVAFLTAIGPFANMTGPPLAAMILPAFGWRSIFLAGVPLPLVAALFAWVALPRAGPIARPRYRWLIEAAAMTVAITSLFLGLKQLPGRSILPVAGLALLFGVGVAVWIRLPQAHGIFRLVAARRLGSPLVSLAAMALTAGVIAFVVPYFLLIYVGESLQVTGLILISLAFCQTLSSAVGGFAMARWGGLPVALAGAGIMSVGGLLLLPLDTRWGAIGMAWRIGIIGIGMGLVGSSNQSTIMGLAPMRHEAAASAISGVSRILSYALGAALASTLAALAPIPLVGLRLALGAAFVLCIVAIAAAVNARHAMQQLDVIDHHPIPHLHHAPMHRLEGLAHDPEHPEYKAPERLPG